MQLLCVISISLRSDRTRADKLSDSIIQFKYNIISCLPHVTIQSMNERSSKNPSKTYRVVFYSLNGTDVWRSGMLTQTSLHVRRRFLSNNHLSGHSPLQKTMLCPVSASWKQYETVVSIIWRDFKMYKNTLSKMQVV